MPLYNIFKFVPNEVEESEEVTYSPVFFEQFNTDPDPDTGAIPGTIGGRCLSLHITEGFDFGYKEVPAP